VSPQSLVIVAPGRACVGAPCIAEWTAIMDEMDAMVAMDGGRSQHSA
jgi:hypothetical protein